MNARCSKTLLLVAVVVAMSIAVPGPALAASEKIDASQLRADMRKLWEDHITWTRQWIVSFAAGLPDQDKAAARLIQNQVDIGNAIKPFYGDEAGTKLTGLLKEHIQGAVELVTAAKGGDAAKIVAAKTKWYKNGDDIAAFLSGANPKNWPLADMKSGMKMHLDTTLQEAQDRLGGKWADDIKDYDRVKEHILALADMLTKGIVKQFPDRFHQVAHVWLDVLAARSRSTSKIL